jgi:predicted amidohydrolase YtcJ
MDSPDIILHRGLFTMLDPSNPTASAVAIKDGMFTAVGHDHEIMALADPKTKVIDQGQAGAARTDRQSPAHHPTTVINTGQRHCV